MTKAETKDSTKQDDASETVKPETVPAKAAREKPPATDLATDDLWGDYAGEGMENIGETDVLIPRLTILQGLSPQLNKSKSEFIKGAQAGEICDVGLRETFAEGVLFLPVFFNKVYIEWAPRESGNGLVAIHDDQEQMSRLIVESPKGLVTKEGTTISETAQFFGFNMTAGGRKSFIPFTSTQMKKSRQWNTLAMSDKARRADGTEFTPPLWYRSYELGTGPESNNKGDWFGWTINRGAKFAALGFPNNGRDMFEACKSFKQALIEGSLRADQSHLEEEMSQQGGGAMADDGGAM